MSDTTEWKKAGAGTLYKRLPHCHLEVRRVYISGRLEWFIIAEINNPYRPTKPEAQRLAHAIARALENVE